MEMENFDVQEVSDLWNGESDNFVTEFTTGSGNRKPTKPKHIFIHDAHRT